MKRMSGSEKRSRMDGWIFSTDTENLLGFLSTSCRSTSEVVASLMASERSCPSLRSWMDKLRRVSVEGKGEFKSFERELESRLKCLTTSEMSSENEFSFLVTFPVFVKGVRVLDAVVEVMIENGLFFLGITCFKL